MRFAIIAMVATVGCVPTSQDAGGGSSDHKVTAVVGGQSISGDGWTGMNLPGYMSIGATDFTSEIDVGFSVPYPPALRTYTLAAGPELPGYVAGDGWGGVSTPSLGYETNATVTGTVTITSYSPADQEVLGTFSFTAQDEGGGPTTITVTNGVFHAYEDPAHPF